jgi:hypothetical protein
MEASGGVVRGNIDSLTKLVAAFEAAGIELIADNAASPDGGRGVRLKAPQAAKSTSNNGPAASKSRKK